MYMNWLKVGIMCVFCFKTNPSNEGKTTCKDKLGIHRRKPEKDTSYMRQAIVLQTTFSCPWQGNTVNENEILYVHSTDVSTIKQKKAFIKLGKASTVYLMTA